MTTAPSHRNRPVNVFLPQSPNTVLYFTRLDTRSEKSIVPKSGRLACLTDVGAPFRCYTKRNKINWNAFRAAEACHCLHSDKVELGVR